MLTLFVYPVLAAVTTAATASVYCWYRHPGFAIRCIFRMSLIRYGLKVKYVQTKNYRFCYAERGEPCSDNLSMLFVHGFSASKDMWLATMSKLPRQIHVILVDLPGHGDTTMPTEKDDISVRQLASDLHDFVDGIGLKKHGFHIIGTSLGGSIAGIYAAMYPEGVKKVTLSCPAMETPVRNEFLDEVDQGHCRLIPETDDELRHMLDSCVHNKTQLNPQIIKGILQLRMPKNGFYRQLFDSLRKEPENDSRDLVNEFLPKITVPTQVIWGKDDELMHVSGAEVLSEKLSNLVQLDILENCGHSIQLETPGRFVKALLKFRGEAHLATNKKEK